MTVDLVAVADMYLCRDSPAAGATRTARLAPASRRYCAAGRRVAKIEGIGIGCTPRLSDPSIVDDILPAAT